MIGMKMKIAATLLLLLQSLIPAAGYEVLPGGGLKATTTAGMVSACVHELDSVDVLDCLLAVSK